MVVDYKARKNEVLDSYDQLEELISALQEYARAIRIPDPLERMGNLMEDIRGKVGRVREDRFTIQKFERLFYSHAIRISPGSHC